jgi:hypothetical protein
MTYRLNNHVGRYVIYLTFDTNGQLSTRLYDKGDDISSANFYSPIVYKGNNKTTELRTILQRKGKTHNYIKRQNQSTTGKLSKA